MAIATAPQSESCRNDRHEHDARDRALYDAWRAGDQAAGDRLVKLYFGPLRRYFVTRALGEHEDLVNDTFVQLLKPDTEFQGSSFRSFLFGIARNLFLEFLRRRYRLQNIDPWTDSLAGVTKGSFSSRLAEREDQRLLLDALAQLSLEDQDLLELHYWQRLTGPELAEIFNRKEATIRSRLGAARKRLLAKFNELSGRPHATELSVEDIEARLLELRDALRRANKRPDIVG